MTNREVMTSEPGRIFTIKFNDGEEWMNRTSEKRLGVWHPVYSDGWRRVDDGSYDRRSHKAALAKLQALGQVVEF